MNVLPFTPRKPKRPTPEWVTEALEYFREHGDPEFGCGHGTRVGRLMDMFVRTHGLPMTWEYLKNAMYALHGIRDELCEFTAYYLFDANQTYEVLDGQVVEVDLDEL